MRPIFDARGQGSPFSFPALCIAIYDPLCNIEALTLITAIVDLAAQDPGKLIVHILVIEVDLFPAPLGERRLIVRHDCLHLSLEDQLEHILSRHRKAGSRSDRMSRPSCRCAPSLGFLMLFKATSNLSGLRSKTNGDTNRWYSLHTDGMSLPTIRPSYGWERTPIQPQRAILPSTLPRRQDITRRQARYLPHLARADPLRRWRRVRSAGA